VFDGPDGKQSLADLFAGRSQLIVYHFMFAPEWDAGCPHCFALGRQFQCDHRASQSPRRQHGRGLARAV